MNTAINSTDEFIETKFQREVTVELKFGKEWAPVEKRTWNAVE